MAELGACGFITGAEGARKGKRRKNTTNEEASVEAWGGVAPFPGPLNPQCTHGLGKWAKQPRVNKDGRPNFPTRN